MASKRTRNRLYWIAVKAIASDDTFTVPPEQVYQSQLSLPDSQLLDYVTAMEDHYGPARLADVSRPELWPAREIVDAVRESA